MKIPDAPDDILVSHYVAIRDDVAKEEATFKAQIADKKKKLEKIENEFLRRFSDRGAESVRTKFGTAYRLTRTSATVADWESFFFQFVVPNQAWDLLEHRAKKDAVVQYKGEHGDLPPGLNWREELTVGFRRA